MSAGVPTTATVPAAARRFATIPCIIDAAREALDTPLWDFLSGGAETEQTLRANRAALDAVELRPRVMVDVRAVDLTTRFLGRDLRLPVVIAPIGSIARFHPDGALATARVAAKRGSICFVSANAMPELGDIASAAPDAALVFQAYGYEDRDVLLALARRAEETGCLALCLTVDSAVYGRRERDLRGGFRPLDKPGRPSLDRIVGAESRESRAGFTWEHLAWLREQTRLPLMLKGVLDDRDAARAVDEGIDALYISNHGGRQLDHAPATTAVLPEIAAAVGGRVPILVDSGYQRGTDIIKGCALGATAVGLGKLQGWALAAGGDTALERVFALLEKELTTSLALLGVPAVRDLCADHVRPPRRA